MDRRAFVLGTFGAVLGCTRRSELSLTSDTAAGAASAVPPLGLQLYTLRTQMAADMMLTLESVASAGYREVEFAGYFDHDPKQIRTMLDAAGLSAPSGHFGYQRVAEDPQEMADFAAAVGHEFLVVPLVDRRERSIDDYRRHAENFNRWGEICKAAGLQFGYHNHEFEFDETDGTVPYDLLLAETDPSLVAFELDLAWAHKGNADAAACFNEWPNRFPMVHLKDMNADGDEVDIGDGDVDFAAILQHAAVGGVKHGFVERDNAVDVEASIRSNFEAISPRWTAARSRAGAQPAHD